MLRKTALALMGFFAAVPPTVAAADAIDRLKENIAKGCNFFIAPESPKDTYLMMWSDGNISTAANTPANNANKDQQWIIYPIDKNYNPQYRIMNRNYIGEFMAVVPTGNVRRWQMMTDNSQEFEFVNPFGDYVKIKEPTRDEVLAVLRDWNLVRWGDVQNDPQQKFEFIPVDCIAPPPLTGVENKTIADSPPQLTSLDGPTGDDLTSKKVLISIEYVPALLVDDIDRFTNKWTQLETVPYYRLERYRFWRTEPRNIFTLDGVSKSTKAVTVYRGMSKTSLDEISNTVGYAVSATGEATTKIDDDTSVKAGLTVSYKNETTARTSKQDQEQNWRSETFTQEFPGVGQQALIVTWTQYDEYILRRGGKDTDTAMWSEPVLVAGRTVTASFPPARELTGTLKSLDEKMR